MKPRIDLRFRPSLIIFLDETGSRICEQLQSIASFTGFDPILCQSIALLKVDSQSQRATPVPLNGKFADERTPCAEDRMDVLIERTLKDVQNNQRIQSIIAAGYPIPNTRTQVFIVGDAHSGELAGVLEIVRKRLSKSGFSTLICYIVNSYRMRQITGPLGNDLSFLDTEQASSFYRSSSYWSERHVPDFCYLYEDMLTYPSQSFLYEHVSHYATAEAIFALIATGLSTEPFFEKQMQISTPFHTYENVGSLSTSLIAFPRTQLLEYCSAKLGVALMAQWLSDLQHQNTLESEREGLQKRAEMDINTLREWIKDSMERPLANSPKKRQRRGEHVFAVEELLWPNLGILLRGSKTQKSEHLLASSTAAEQQAFPHGEHKAHLDLQEATETLFLLFWPEDIWDEFQRQKLRATDWTRLVGRRGNRAVASYAEWDRGATRAWNTAATRINTEIRATIDRLWSRDQNGFEMATTYVNALDEQLAKLANDQSSWREEHQEHYKAFFEAYAQLAEGEWVSPDDAVGTGGAQARPTMGNQHVDMSQKTSTATNSAAAQSTIIGGNTTPVGTSHQHLPEREERVAQRLEDRIKWYQARIPPLATQIVVAIPFILALILTSLVWIPHTIVAIASAAAGITLAVGLAHGFFHRMYSKQLEECKEDLLIFYRRYYAYKCEMREDKLRVVTVLGPLRRSVQTVRVRLDNIKPFIEQTRDMLDEQAEQIQKELFNSPAGLRDIFVANGERLQREKRNTLADFVGQISKLRIKEPKEEWHQSSADLKRRLIKQFHQQSESLMELSDSKAREQIFEFASDVTRSYFKGPLIDLQNALDKEDIWIEALDRVETPLYQTQVGIKDPQFLFVCGRNQDMIKGLRHIPTHAYPVRVSDTHEWVLLAAFFRGGLPATINPEILFPEKVRPGQQEFLAGQSIGTSEGDDEEEDDDGRIDSPAKSFEDDKLPW